MSIASNLSQYTVNLLTTIIDSADKMTIGQMVDEAYLCLLDTSWDLPVRKYTRKAQVIAELQHVISRIGACPAFAEPVPEVSDKQAADHLVHAGWMKGQLVAHGIDPQDFEAAIAWCVGNGNIVPRYWISIYVDYVYQVTPFCPDEGCPHSDTVHYCNTLPSQAPLWDCPKAGSERTAIAVSSLVVEGTQIHQQIERLIVTGQQAGLLRADGYTGELEIVDVMPGLADDMRQFIDYSSRRGNWRPMTDQEARAAFNYQDQLKLNKFPRGKCARRMLTLGWHFNED